MKAWDLRNMSTQTKVALEKQAKPERFCPHPRCLWRTGDGGYCPRHGGTHDTHAQGR